LHIPVVSFCHHLASVVSLSVNFSILIFSSETPGSIELKLGMKHPWEVLYKICINHPGPLKIKWLP
jgi:hypothetical protein